MEAIEKKIDQMCWDFDWVTPDNAAKAIQDALSDHAMAKLHEGQDSLQKVAIRVGQIHWV